MPVQFDSAMAAIFHSSAKSLPFSARVKSAIWEAVAAAVAVARIAVVVSGRTRKIDTIIYKADRLGDLAAGRGRPSRASPRPPAPGAARRRSTSGRDARARRCGPGGPPDCPVEAFELEPQGCLAKIRRALAVVRLLVVYEARTFVCLRYSPEPVRNFVLAHVRATEIHAMSWLIALRPQLGVPHEIFRHYKILEGLGLAPDESGALLPKMVGRREAPAALAVLAPYSSAAIKDWRDEGWCEIATELFARGFQVELWVGPNQTGARFNVGAKTGGPRGWRGSHRRRSIGQPRGLGRGHCRRGHRASRPTLSPPIWPRRSTFPWSACSEAANTVILALGNEAFGNAGSPILCPVLTAIGVARGSGSNASKISPRRQ